MLDAAMSAASAVGALGLLLVSAVFIRSLRSGATPLIQRFALAEDPITAQQAPATRYLRGLTALWAIALLVAAAFVIRRAAGDPVLPGVTGAGVTFAPMLLLFFGERRVRPHVLGDSAVGPAALQWRIASEILRDEMRSIALFIFGRA